MTHDPARTVTAIASWLGDTAGRIHPTLRNLREVQPGYPTTTPGSGSVGGGAGTGDSIVERLAGTIAHDDAVRDLARIRRLITELEPRASELHTLCLRWGYTTAGEYRPARSTHHQRPTETDSNRGRWCTSCERIHVAEPVHRDGLCRWCYDVNRAEGVWPPIEVLDAHHRGIRITDPMMRSALARTPPGADGRRHGRKKRSRR